ncbi:MAG: MlaD family protein [Verrucomicrobiota bacterium]|jgi:phospholipid/cholesterol/gamma-HCH transport system substrate-binding protein
MKNTLETRLGIFVALVVIAAVLILEFLGGTERFGSGLRLRALFSNVQDLKTGDRVKMAGKEIGRVDDIRLEETNNKVLVIMKVDPKVLVRTDSTATIKFTGLMGQNFVSLDFGSRNAPPAKEGTYLSTAETPDLSAMMTKVDNVATGVENLAKSFTGEKIDNLLGPFTDFLKANKGPLTATIANIQAISSQLSQGQGTVGKLIYEPALYNSALAAVSNVQDTATEIKTTVVDARKVVDQVNQAVAQANAGQGTVGKLLKDEGLYRETTASMTQLKEILQKINQGQGSVGKLVNDRELYNNAKLTLQKLDKATEGLEDQGPLSVMGILVNNLF